MDEKDFEKAADMFRQSAELDPHFKTLELLGETYIRLNRLSDAIIPLAASVSLNRGGRAASLLAEVFLHLKKYPAAKEMAEIALNRQPDNRRALAVVRTLADSNAENSAK